VSCAGSCETAAAAVAVAVAVGGGAEVDTAPRIETAAISRIGVLVAVGIIFIIGARVVFRGLRRWRSR